MMQKLQSNYIRILDYHLKNVVSTSGLLEDIINKDIDDMDGSIFILKMLMIVQG
jgi:hypothetical protein